MASENGNGDRASFWMKAASWTFGLWAIGVPLTGALIVDAVKGVQREQHELNDKFVDWREQMEKKYAVVDERQGVLMKKMEMIETDHHAWFYDKMQQVESAKRGGK